MNNSGIPLKSLLLLDMFICAFLAFFSGWGQIGTPYVFLFVVLMAVSMFIEWRNLPHPPRIIINAASIGILLSSFMRARFDNVINVFMEAILLMIAVKMLEKKRSRDYNQVIILSALNVVSAAVLSAGGMLIYYSFLISLFAGLGIMLNVWFYKDPDAKLSFREVRQVVSRSMVLWLMMLPVCLLLFFLTPRVKMTVLQFQRYNQGITGFSEQVTHGSVRNIQQSNAVVFRAEMPEIPLENLYWRGLILEEFTGNTWVSSRRFAPRGAFRAEGEQIVQRLFLEPGYHRAFFALDKPVMVEGEGAFPIGEGIFIHTNARQIRQLNYTAVSVISSTLQPHNPEIPRSLYLQLPENFIPALRNIVEEMTEGKDENEKIRAIMSYLAPPNFEYSLENLPVSQDALEEFLFSHKKGNCEYFASAMAVMLRMADVPVRLIAGYKGGFYNSGGGYYIIQQESAHVWVEAWSESEKLWRRYDPTPVNTSINSFGLRNRYNILSMYMDVINYKLSRLFVEYDFQSQSQFFMRLKELISNPSSALPKLEELIGTEKRLLAVLAVILLVAAILYFLFPRLRDIRCGTRIPVY